MPKPTLLSESERRTQARLSAQVPIRLRVGGESTTRPATLIDLSWGGALCQLPTALPLTDQRIRLQLPWTPGETIEIEATRLRQKELENARHLLAVRFERLSLSNQGRLEKLLGHLQASDSPGLSHQAPSLVATLEVLIQTLDEWRWALGDIARGRLRISAPTAFTPGQSLGLQFNGVPARARLRLRARVLACEDSPLTEMRTVRSQTLTLEFEHPLDILRQWAEWLLGQIPPDSSPSAPPPADRPQATRTAVIPARLVLTQGERSALEIGFPEALDYLMIAWGDVSTFEIVFRRLILGDTGMDGTWTPESWEELQFLQDVHDAAYGLSETRRSRLKTGRDVH
jgi:hypothetical protein